MSGETRRKVFITVAVLFAGACGEDEKKSSFPPGFAAAQTSGAPATPVAAGPAAGGAPAQAPLAGQLESPLEQTKEQLLAEARERKFKNEDFVESDGNRDPFHSFLNEFGTVADKVTPQYEILLQKYSLDELKLAMIVGPGTTDGAVKSRVRDASGHHVEPRAMFIDPSGLGVVIVRGNHISKSDAQVVRIEPELSSVTVEIREDLGAGKSRTVKRVLELHQGEPIGEGKSP